VINVVTGSGAHVGEALVGHRDVSMVSFTGSTNVGRQVAARAAGAVKRVHLELGGKAPFVVFDDANLDAAARGAVAASMVNAGQDCTAATRAYVQEPLFDAFLEAVASYLELVQAGPTDDEATDLGSLITAAHRDKVHGFVQRAQDKGAKVVVGGHPLEGELADGAYYAPTLITNVDQQSEVVQSEIFGPVLVALPFTTDDQGLQLANDTPYGLAASAWTTSLFRAQRSAETIKAGCVWLNDHIPIISEMPHGGYKQSGYGKDMSTYSLDEYTQVKHVMSSRDDVAHKSWHDIVFAGNVRER
jgi:betaine-aldehyde dehydrogenase